MSYRFWKRVGDLFISLFLLLLLLPVVLLCSLLVKLSSPGPVFYRAERIGQGGVPFFMAKFRTMIVGADQVGPGITAAGDPRITRVGAFLRASKLDEVPQLWNVLVGEMSLVGPRPNLRKFTDAYTEEEREILSVPQGMTDYASLWFRAQEQLHRGIEDAEADYLARVAPVKIRLARYYVHHGSLGRDIALFFATIGAVFFRINPRWCFPSEEILGVRESIPKPE